MMTNKNIKAQIYVSFTKNEAILDKINFLNNIIKSVKKSTVGYAGFNKKKYLKNYLEGIIFDANQKKNIEEFHFDERLILEEMKLIIKKCRKAIPSSEALYFFIFPTFNQFIIQKMNGVAGFSPRKNTVLLFIHPKQYKNRALKETICHEYNHSVIHRYHKWKTLLDSIIFEGLAENFRISIIGGNISPWAKALPKGKSLRVLNEIKENLYSKNNALYKKLFWGSKKFPMWSGYALGFNIIKSFISMNPNYTWEELIKLKPKEILKYSGWNK